MPSEDVESKQNVFAHRGRILRYVKSPLGFYTLALLIVESFLLGAGKLFDLSESVRISAMYVGVGLFVGVVAVVTVLVIKYPKALVFTEQSHLEWEYMQVHGEKTKPLPGGFLEPGSGSEPPQKPVGQTKALDVNSNAGDKQ
jgi:hypothetical protein